MVMFGVNVAVLDAGRVLMTQRSDLPVWCLPGGFVDDGESVATAAVREVREETGLDVALTRLVGVYSRPRWRRGGGHDLLFAAHPVGGALAVPNAEVLDARWCEPAALPDPLLWWFHQRIRDAFAGVGGSVARSQHAVWPFEEDLYERLERGAFTLQDEVAFYCSPPRPQDEQLEVGPNGENASDGAPA